MKYQNISGDKVIKTEDVVAAWNENGRRLHPGVVAIGIVEKALGDEKVRCHGENLETVHLSEVEQLHLTGLRERNLLDEGPRRYHEIETTREKKAKEVTGIVGRGEDHRRGAAEGTMIKKMREKAMPVQMRSRKLIRMRQAEGRKTKKATTLADETERNRIAMKRKWRSPAIAGAQSSSKKKFRQFTSPR